MRGLTIIELMVTVSIMAILVVAVIPNMTKFIANIQLVSQVNSLVADIIYARNEAATRGKQVSLCASQNVATSTSPTCAASGTTAWATGRIVFVDLNYNGVRDATTNPTTDDTLLVKTPGMSTGYSLTASGFADTSHLTFSTYGGLTPSTAGSFKACHSSSNAGYSVAVPITGQPQSTTITSCP